VPGDSVLAPFCFMYAVLGLVSIDMMVFSPSNEGADLLGTSPPPRRTPHSSNRWRDSSSLWPAAGPPLGSALPSLPRARRTLAPAAFQSRRERRARSLRRSALCEL